MSLSGSPETTMKDALKTLWVPNRASLTEAEETVVDDSIDAFIDALKVWLLEGKVTVTIPSSTFLIAATAGVLNPAPVVVDGELSAGDGGLT